MKNIIVYLIIIFWAGCSSLPPLPKNEYTGPDIKLHSDYNIEQVNEPNGSSFKLTSPANEKILVNLYKLDGTLVGTLYEGQGGSTLLNFDTVSKQYDFRLEPRTYIIVLYGQRGKAGYKLYAIGSNGNEFAPGEEIDYNQLAEQHALQDSLGRIIIKPYPIGGIRGIQAKLYYPVEAVQKGIEGKVRVICWIDTTGNVTKTKLLEGLGYGLDESVVKALQTTKFTPTRVDGKAVEDSIVMPFVFGLSSMNKTE